MAEYLSKFKIHFSIALTSFEFVICSHCITLDSLFLNNIMQLGYIMKKKPFFVSSTVRYSRFWQCVLRKRDTIHIFFPFSCDDGLMFSDSHRVALTLQVIFQRASGTILSHDTRGQSFAKPPERTDITDESRPENADNEQQQERVSQRRGFICNKVVMHLNIMTNILGQRPQKTSLYCEMEYWTRKKGTLKQEEKYTPSSIKTVTHQCFFLQTTGDNWKNQKVYCYCSLLPTHIFLDDRIQANATKRSAASWWVTV